MSEGGSGGRVTCSWCSYFFRLFPYALKKNRHNCKNAALSSITTNISVTVAAPVTVSVNVYEPVTVNVTVNVPVNKTVTVNVTVNITVSVTVNVTLAVTVNVLAPG